LPINNMPKCQKCDTELFFDLWGPFWKCSSCLCLYDYKNPKILINNPNKSNVNQSQIERRNTMKIDWDALPDVLVPTHIPKLIPVNINLVRAEIMRCRQGKSSFPAIILGVRKSIIPKEALRKWLESGGKIA
jgi:hypothetical protein